MAVHMQFFLSCVNYDILVSKERKNCMCTAMLYDPKDHYEPEETTQDFKKHSKLYERFMRIKQWKLLAPFMKKENGGSAENPSFIFSLISSSEPLPTPSQSF